jgi:predicted DsbA family dithiol-disulfide isomerase
MSNRQGEATNEAGDQRLVFVEYFTDPLCSWSWAFEVQWRRLRYECAEHLGWRYRMGGLIADWRSYDDPLNDIRSPSQMGPQWFQVQEMSGMPLNDRLWQVDPPASSYPACIAMKAAERQGQAPTESYLRRLREAAMIESRNIGRREVLLAVAQEAARDGLLDLKRFNNDLDASETMEAFRQDLRDAAYYNIGRFPTLILHRNDGRGIVLVGYRPYEALQAAIEYLVPGVIQRSELPPEDLAVAYVTYWRRVVARELVEIMGGDISQTSALLESLVARGLLMLEDDSLSTVPIYVPATQQ